MSKGPDRPAKQTMERQLITISIIVPMFSSSNNTAHYYNTTSN